MSYVSNVILAFDCREDTEARLFEVNSFFQNELNHFKELPKSSYCGKKVLEQITCVGAINYLGTEAFISHVKEKVNWEHPKGAQLFICDQDDDSYTERLQN